MRRCTRRTRPRSLQSPIQVDPSGPPNLSLHSAAKMLISSLDVGLFNNPENPPVDHQTEAVVRTVTECTAQQLNIHLP